MWRDRSFNHSESWHAIHNYHNCYLHIWNTSSVLITISLDIKSGEVYFFVIFIFSGDGHFRKQIISASKSSSSSPPMSQFILGHPHKSHKMFRFPSPARPIFAAYKVAMLPSAGFICLRVAYREAFWEELSRLIWRGVWYGGHCCFQYMYRMCNIFPELTVASWFQFSR